MAPQQIKKGDWVKVENSDLVGFVRRVARNGAWADVDWHTHVRRMPTQFLHVQTSLHIWGCEVIDLDRQWELEGKRI